MVSNMVNPLKKSAGTERFQLFHNLLVALSAARVAGVRWPVVPHKESNSSGSAQQVRTVGTIGPRLQDDKI